MALALSVAADLILFIPMLVRTARYPSSEIPAPFLAKMGCALLTVLAVRHFDGPSLTWPIYPAAINGAIGVLALSPTRRGAAPTLAARTPGTR